MSNYWKSHYETISNQFNGQLLKQVGKTVNGREISDHQVQLIVENAVSVLRLNSKDNAVDLCCGNGLITRQLALFVERIVGIDFTSGLIDTARRYNASLNTEYVNSDVLHLDRKYLLGSKKVIMYEALQHFTDQQFTILLDELQALEHGSMVLIGSIPDKDKLKVYYDTDEKYAFYLQRESEGKPHIGRWWVMGEIKQLVAAHGFNATLLPQVSTLYTAYYRFDVLLEKCE